MIAAEARELSPGLRLLYAPANALQFLTRLPLPGVPYHSSSLADGLAFFPLVGGLLGWVAGLADFALAPHVGPRIAALAAVLVTVLLTGALHEDGLADCADAFGMRHARERTLLILRDSRIGTYGALALGCSLLGRVGLLAELPSGKLIGLLVAAHALGRWSSLPLALIPPARAQDGQGSRVAGRIAWPVLLFGTLSALGLAGWMLGRSAWAPVLATGLVTAGSGWFYVRRLGGITGDCFGATEQLAELAVLLCGVWR